MAPEQWHSRNMEAGEYSPRPRRGGDIHNSHAVLGRTQGLPDLVAGRKSARWPVIDSFGYRRTMLRPYLSILCLLSCTAVAQPLRLDLSAAEERLVANREILAARRAAEGAEAAVVVAGQAPNPTFNYGATGISLRNGVGSGSLWDKRVDQTVGLSQLIERGDKRELRAGNARNLQLAATADLADVRRQQRLALHQAYYDLKAAQERLRLQSETAELYERSTDVAALRLKAGDISAVDESRLRVEMLRSRNDKRAAQADQEKAQQALAYLIGEEQRAAELLATDEWPPLRDAGKNDPVLEQRPDVKAAQARTEAAARARELTRSMATRDVTVGVQIERNPPDSGTTVGFSVSVPLFVRYAYEGEISRAEIDYTAARETEAAVLARARVEQQRALADLLSAADRRRRTEGESLPEARRVADAAEYAFKRGAISLTDLLDARRTLRSLALEAVAAQADHAKANSAWLAATQWEAPGQ